MGFCVNKLGASDIEWQSIPEPWSSTSEGPIANEFLMKTHLRLSDGYGVFQYNPLDRFVAGWGSKGAFVGKVRCVYRGQTWNKAGQRYAVSQMIPDPLVEKKTGSHY